MKSRIFQNTPLFIPKTNNTKLPSITAKYSAVMVDAHIINSWKEKTSKPLKESSNVLIINPVTSRLLYKDARDKAYFKKLPYPKVTSDKLYSDVNLRNSLINSCLDIQIKNGSSLIIAPYFFAEDIDHTNFTNNLTLLSETIKIIKENQITHPLFAMINIGNTSLFLESKVNHIVDRYLDYDNNLAGVFVMIDDLDDRDSDYETLSGLAHMIFQLSNQYEVFINAIGGFGEILCALGATGFISGLGRGETSNVKMLQNSPSGFSNIRDKEWTYIPEIFDYANDVEVKKIKYSCQCPFCKGAVPTDTSSKKGHFLCRRIESVNAMSEMNFVERINYMLERVDNAIKTVNGYKSSYGSPFETSHLLIWKKILEDAKAWTPSLKEDDEELEKLLYALEN